MKAVVCHRGELSVQEMPAPVPGRGQVLITVERCGICGSDLHARAHADQLADSAAAVGYHSAMRPADQVVLGHEIVGTVAGYGPGARRKWKLGTRVVGLPIVQDGASEAGVRMVGFDKDAIGGYAEQVVLQESFTFEVPERLDADIAAFTEPLSVALHAVRRGSVQKKQPAYVIGCGPIGLAVILILKAAGVRTVIASDYSARRRDLAIDCGADVVVDPALEDPLTAAPYHGPLASMPELLSFAFDAIGKVRRIPGLPWTQLLRAGNRLGVGPAGPVIFECVGVPGILDRLVTAAPLRTRIVVAGVCMEPDTFRPAIAVNKEIDMRFVFGYDPGEFAETLRMLAAGKIDPRPLHTGTVGLEQVAEAFDDLGSPDGHAKILVNPQA
ncbi:putative zinc-containing alcohol dehydrogenase [Gordonia hirsuta DSM 44140 = NBRC 16056]|uniref:Putative zinc-containing alcohol dehydrogenase n=1 Tax=Gordonia hirsuta DSM 44140 = NBRC 16056 TaxID=1121927 RepID=L7L8W5_9ACTN|nr:zinc-binding dehydrogenase [Gordonia hirsuta]GAC57379.1 putative zinc-containing alcohol dehydrogenase [Gordonia hirsuta DSM 44140 = NBRC 16056]